MSKQKRSRALLRNLRKQARKGTLSAREKQQLLSQEKKFRKARKSTAKGVGAGLAGAAALLSTSAGQQLMSGAKDAMGRASDRRMDNRVARADKRSKKEAEKLEELARQREEETGRRLSEGADRIEEQEREEDRQKLLARADEFERQERDRVTRPVTDVDFGMGPEGPTRDEFDDYRRQRAEELGAQVLTPEEQQMQRFRNRTAVQALRGDRSDLPPGDTDYTGGFETTGAPSLPAGPINEPAFSLEDPMMPASEAGPRAEEGREMLDPDRPVMTRQGMDLDTMIRMGGRVGSEDDRGDGLAADLSDYTPEEIRALFRPDLDQEEGGKVEYGIGGAILGGINALRSGQGLGGAALAAGKGFVTPGSGIAQGAKLAGGLLAGSQNPALAKFGQIAQAGSNFLPGGGGAMGALGALPGLLSGEQGMKVQEMRQGGRAADLKKMIAKKYGFR